MTDPAMQSNEAPQQPEPAQSPQSRSGEPTGEVATTQESDTESRALTRWLNSPAKVGTVAGGVVLGAAVLLGPLEAALGAGAAYAAYRVVRKRNAEEKETTEAAQSKEKQDPKAA